MVPLETERLVIREVRLSDMRSLHRKCQVSEHIVCLSALSQP